VTDLRAEVDTDGVRFTWTPPETGNVELRALAADSDQPRVGLSTTAKARLLGTSVRRSPTDAEGELRVPRGGVHSRQLFVPVTVLGDLAAVGTGIEVDPRQQTLRSLRADRMGSVVRLRWEWVPGVPQVRVVWRAGTRPTGPEDPEARTLDVSQIEYVSRGVRIATEAAGQHWFGVCTVTRDRGEPVYGPLSYCQETSTAEIGYTIAKSLLGRFTLSFPDNGPVPEVVLVARSGLRPTRQGDGVEVLRLPAGAGPQSVKFALPPGLARPVHFRVFPVGPGVSLVPSGVLVMR
jgi:hypothetical protein